MCAESKDSGGDSPVRDFSVEGFEQGEGARSIAEAHAQFPELLALKFAACVAASYDSATKQVCFTLPVYGKFCVKVPIPIPPGHHELKACAETCGSPIPHGVKVTIYLDGKAIFTKTIVGFC